MLIIAVILVLIVYIKVRGRGNRGLSELNVNALCFVGFLNSKTSVNIFNVNN